MGFLVYAKGVSGNWNDIGISFSQYSFLLIDIYSVMQVFITELCMVAWVKTKTKHFMYCIKWFIMQVFIYKKNSEKKILYTNLYMANIV